LAAKGDAVIRARTGVSGVAMIVTVLMSSGAPGLAHHSFAPYEPTLQIKLSGVVTAFRWSNPHVYIEMDAIDPSTKKARHWLIECANPGILNRVGWKFNMVKVGDPISAIVSPLRNGEPAALLKQITLADGRKYSNGGPAGRATIE
jgi:Family of unknown function (DUF6152)